MVWDIMDKLNPIYSFLIEDDNPLYVPDDASNTEQAWWFLHGQNALNQEGYLNIPGLTLQQYRDLDKTILTNFGLHVNQLPEAIQSLILNSIGNPNYLTNENLPAILQQFGITNTTPGQETESFLILFASVMAIIALLSGGATLAGSAGYTIIANIITGTLHIADALDDIDDLLSIIQNSEYLIDLINGRGDTAQQISKWFSKLFNEWIRPNINTQDIRDLGVSGHLPASATGSTIYLFDWFTDFWGNQFPGDLHLYTYDSSQGIWILTAVIPHHSEQWWHLIFNPRPNDPPLYNGQGTKGWKPGDQTIHDRTGNDILLQVFQLDTSIPDYVSSNPERYPRPDVIVPPPLVAEQKLQKIYSALLESEEPPYPEVFQIPNYAQSPIDPRGGPGGGIMTKDQLPIHILQPIDQNTHSSYINLANWTWVGIDEYGNQYYTYNSGNFMYYLVYDPKTGQWRNYTRPHRLKDFDNEDEGKPDAQGSFPPPYGINIINTFGEIIFVETTGEYLKYNPQTGRYEQINIGGVGIFDHPSGNSKIIILQNGQKINVIIHKYHPLMYDVSGIPRPRPWYVEQGLPWWTEPYWTHTENPPPPLPNNWDQFSGYLNDFIKYFSNWTPLGGQY
jgi:hypothetical protein